MKHPNVQMTLDHLGEVLKAIGELSTLDVLVGIPGANNAREEGAAGNALIGYTMEHGSPEHNVPARPFLVPGVRKAQPRVLLQLKRAAEEACSGRSQGLRGALNAAGAIAANQVKREIDTNIPPPLAPETVANRYRERRVKKRRQGEKDYLSAVAAGVDPASAQYGIGIVALINTGQMRNAVTHVVRKAKR